jgi:hypothetical protein
MKDFSPNLIQHKAGLIEAMKKLGEVPGNLTLFVVDPRDACWAPSPTATSAGA